MYILNALNLLKMGRTTSAIYQFDLLGKLFAVFEDYVLAGDWNNMPKESIRSAVRRKACVAKKYYFSQDENFAIPQKKKQHNPLFYKQRKSRAK